jgi:2-polyprenyl-3-methyl-5-hydroxy-6-metoxy-1,4-benzoquinol methylase
MSDAARSLREEDIRPAALMAEQARLYAADVARLLEGADAFVEVPCPACEEPAWRPQWSKYGLTYRSCLACQTVYVSPRPTPAQLDEYYRTSANYEYWNRVVFPASEAARREKIFRPRAQRIAELAPLRGTLLDVGAGYGTFCEEVRFAFDRVIALEPEPHLAASCRERGLEVVQARIEDAPLDGRVDVITAFEVIEHLFSPRAFLERCAELLDDDGGLVLTCPNGLGFDIQTLGEASATVDAEHLNYFTPESLARLARRCGFDVVDVSTPGRLDAELVRKAALAGEVELDADLRRALVDEWEERGEAFQDHLVAAGYSSNLWLVARRARRPGAAMRPAR